LSNCSNRQKPRSQWQQNLKLGSLNSAISFKALLKQNVSISYATSRKVTGLSLNEVLRFATLPNTSSCLTDLGIDSASNINKHQKSSWRLKGSRRVRLTTSPSVSRLSLQCGNFNVSHNPIGLQGLLQG
jgi:hypothetical protein